MSHNEMVVLQLVVSGILGGSLALIGYVLGRFFKRMGKDAPNDTNTQTDQTDGPIW